MKKGSKIGIGIGTVVVVGIAAYFIINSIKKKRSNSDTEDFDTPTNSGSTVDRCSVIAPLPLRKGAYGKQVKFIQEKLNSDYGKQVSVDCSWGGETESALNSIGEFKKQYVLMQAAMITK